MGHKLGLVMGFSLVLVVGLFATATLAFADEMENGNSPFSFFYGIIQNLKYGDSSDKFGISASEELSATVISELETQVADLTTRVNTLEEPPKIHTTELLAVTDIDCSNRNMIEAFLSGWCPHPTRNIYFIEDSRIQPDSIIAVTLLQNEIDFVEEQTICGVVNQHEFNFSFRDPKNGEVTVLEDLHGFVMKCDYPPQNQYVLKYTIINS